VCLNELAKILENPFGQDAEDICLEDFHGRFLQMMEGTRHALDVQHESRAELRKCSVGKSSQRQSMLRRVQLLQSERGDGQEQDVYDTQSTSERSPSPKQTVYGQSLANTVPTDGSDVAAWSQGAPTSIEVTGVWCELPQQGGEKHQDGVLQDPRSNGVSAAGHGILPTSGNNRLLSGVGCLRGLLCPDREAGQSKEVPFKNAVEASSKTTCVTWVPQKDELRDSTTAGMNPGITARDNRGMEQRIDRAAGSPPEQRGYETA